MLFLLASLSSSLALTYALTTSDEGTDRRMRRVAWTLGEPSAEVKLAGHGELWRNRFAYDGMTLSRCSSGPPGGRTLGIDDVRARFAEQGTLLYEARLAAAETSALELWRSLPCLAEAVDGAPEQALLASALYRSALAEYRVVFMNRQASTPEMDAALGRAAMKAQLAARFDAPSTNEVARVIVENEDGQLLIQAATERTAECKLHLLFGGSVSIVLDNARVDPGLLSMHAGLHLAQVFRGELLEETLVFETISEPGAECVAALAYPEEVGNGLVDWASRYPDLSARMVTSPVADDRPLVVLASDSSLRRLDVHDPARASWGLEEPLRKFPRALSPALIAGGVGAMVAGGVLTAWGYSAAASASDEIDQAESEAESNAAADRYDAAAALTRPGALLLAVGGASATVGLTFRWVDRRSIAATRQATRSLGEDYRR